MKKSENKENRRLVMFDHIVKSGEKNGGGIGEYKIKL